MEANYDPFVLTKSTSDILSVLAKSISNNININESVFNFTDEDEYICDGISKYLDALSQRHSSSALHKLSLVLNNIIKSKRENHVELSLPSIETRLCSTFIPRYMLFAVSGTLQDGFELRPNLNDGDLEAKFLGYALIRGVKSYFDIKLHGRPGWAPDHCHVNPCLVLTDDLLDANVYAIYLTPVNAIMAALAGEPRYLSVSPATVYIDVEAEETSDKLKTFFNHVLLNDNHRISVLTVLSTYKGYSFIENPVLYTKSDGTRVTNFHDGIAILAGTTHDKRGSQEYADAIDEMLKRSEAMFDVNFKEIYGASASDVRLTRQYVLSEFESIWNQI